MDMKQVRKLNLEELEARVAPTGGGSASGSGSGSGGPVAQAVALVGQGGSM